MLTDLVDVGASGAAPAVDATGGGGGGEAESRPESGEEATRSEELAAVHGRKRAKVGA